LTTEDLTTEPREDAMIDARHIETLLQDAIALLEESGFPMAAEALRDNLRGIRTAPTGGARRRRVFQLRDLFEGTGPGPDVFHSMAPIGPTSVRYRRSDAQRRDEDRYRKTLGAIQEVLAVGASEDASDGHAWNSSVARVA
jgi:hypothetical protein